MALTITKTNISADADRGSDIRNYLATSTVNIGDAVYLDSNNQVVQAQALTSAAARAIGIVVGAPNFYGETAIAAGQYAAVCVNGPVFGFTGLASGSLIWVDKTTAGGMASTAPTGAYQFAVGRAIGADVIFVDPGVASPVSA